MNSWATPESVRTRLRKLWVNGSLLRDYATGQPFVDLDIPVKGPSAKTLADNIDEARRWAAQWQAESAAGKSFSLVPKRVGGRHLGHTEIPGRIHINSYAQAFRFLRVLPQVDVFREVLEMSEGHASATAWALRRPLKALELAPEWARILSAVEGLNTHRDTGLYLRQVHAPGVDTKFIERHRATLSQILEVSGKATEFVHELGLQGKPGMVRMRFDPAVFGMPAGITEGEFRVAELDTLAPDVQQALIVENEITYLSTPIPRRGVVVWGRGFDAVQAASLTWLRAARVRYWGDIDTHGFAILHRVRAHLPDVESVLMDRETLINFQERWSVEETPTSATLPSLTETESQLYQDLVTDRYGLTVRLEQERIDWGWARQALSGD